MNATIHPTSSRKGLRGIAAALLVAACLEIGSSRHALAAKQPSSPESNTSAMSPRALLEQIRLLKEINTLGLDMSQAQPILSQLSRIKSTSGFNTANEDAYLKGIRDRMERERTALLAGQSPAAADDAAVTRATQLIQQGGNAQVERRAAAVDAIRRTLTPTQLDLLRQYTGIPAVGESEIEGAAQNAAQTLDVWGLWSDADLTRLGNSVLGVLDYARSLPLLTFHEQRETLALRLLDAAGVSLTSPVFPAARSMAVALLDQTHDMMVGQYNLVRQQVALDTVRQAYFSQMNALQLIQGASAAVVQADNEAVRRFFLQPGVQPLLQQRFVRAGAAGQAEPQQ